MKVDVDIKGLDDFLNENVLDENLYKAVQSMAEETKDFWYSIAGKRLKSTRTLYQGAIKIEGYTSEGFDVVLDGGFLPWALEVGTDPYPMVLPAGKVAPLNVNRQIVFTTPDVWRSGGNIRPWEHPGFPGFNMRDDVVEELWQTILPRHLDEILSKL
jgi:hypothetical protein